MKATIKPYSAGEAEGFIIIFTDNAGKLIGNTAVTEVELDCASGPSLKSPFWNRVKVPA